MVEGRLKTRSCHGRGENWTGSDRQRESSATSKREREAVAIRIHHHTERRGGGEGRCHSPESPFHLPHKSKLQSGGGEVPLHRDKTTHRKKTTGLSHPVKKTTEPGRTDSSCQDRDDDALTTSESDVIASPT
ncbi:hypothetical protein CRG98_036385 [Punica granatum]|uniref:Uncharacterized protein n=1 Tax=Punica granatum TaxID=22663 RepID=A0A2I0IGU3_PUNGR|nr:hypothetical protein CRG98_036385 [Punica granatum]